MQPRVIKTRTSKYLIVKTHILVFDITVLNGVLVAQVLAVVCPERKNNCYV